MTPSLHHDYLAQLRRYLTIHRQNLTIRTILRSYARELLMLATLTIDAVRDDLAALYCPTGQGAPRDPVSLLRSLLLMTLCRVAGLDAWVDRLRREPVLAVLAGFEPQDVPGASTHRDFLARLADGPYAVRALQDQTLMQAQRGRHTHHLSDRTRARQDAVGPYHSQSERLAADLLAHADDPRDPLALQTRLQNLLLTLGLRPSLETHLLPAGQLVIEGDGTELGSHASPSGFPTCACPPHDPDCDHPRQYLSATAQWCYNAHLKRFIFGDRYYTLSIHLQGHDLPLLTIIPGGNESDFTLSLKAIDDLLKLIRDAHLPLTIQAFVGDGHHDADAIYRYLLKKGILTVIPLTKYDDATHPHADAFPDVRFDDDGVPLCPAGCRLRYQGLLKRGGRRIYACPAVHATHDADGHLVRFFRPEECPRHANCHPQAKLGYNCSFKMADDPRLFPALSRDSAQYAAWKRERSGCERSNATDDSYHLDRCHRNVACMAIRLTLVNIVKHAVVRYLEAVQTLPEEARFTQTMAQLEADVSA